MLKHKENSKIIYIIKSELIIVVFIALSLVHKRYLKIYKNNTYLWAGGCAVAVDSVAIVVPYADDVEALVSAKHGRSLLHVYTVQPVVNKGFVTT